VNRLVDGYFSLLKLVIVLCLAGMVVLVFTNVVLRYAFNSGITVSEELSRWLFVWLVFLGAIIGMREHGHLGMDSLVSRLPVWGKKACLIASQLLMIYATWLFLQGSWTQDDDQSRQRGPASGLPMSLVYGIGVVFCVSVIPILLVRPVPRHGREAVGRRARDDHRVRGAGRGRGAQSRLEPARRPCGCPCVRRREQDEIG
jgi:TRAP-type C4-dicarboxylate transport system permease small subunit